MATDFAHLDSDRIARFLRNRLGEHTWRVDEAKAKLTKIMNEAKSGRPQLVGVQKPVVMVGLEELEELVLKLREPETWGEYFSTHFDDAEDNIDLTSPSRPGVASYALDTGVEAPVSASESKFAGINPKDVEIDNYFFDDIELAQAYAEFGDNDAVSAILSCARDTKAGRKKSWDNIFGEVFETLSSKNKRVNVGSRLTSYLIKHPTGSLVDCRVVGSDDKRIVLIVNGDMPAVAFTRDAQLRAFKKGSMVRACIVKRIPNREGIAVSLCDKKTGQILPTVGLPDLHKKTQ